MNAGTAYLLLCVFVVLFAFTVVEPLIETITADGMQGVADLLDRARE